MSMETVNNHFDKNTYHQMETNYVFNWKSNN